MKALMVIKKYNVVPVVIKLLWHCKTGGRGGLILPSSDLDSGDTNKCPRGLKSHLDLCNKAVCRYTYTCRGMSSIRII